jgi:hypothetical protein
MKPLFTIHGGEYLVGSHIERHFKNVSVWIPSRDTGVDLLVSDKRLRRAVSLQVKFSKDFLPHMNPLLQKDLRACGWWTIDRDKLRGSSAEFWIFVLPGFAARTTDFVIMRRKELLRRLRTIHGNKKKIQIYIWVTNSERCWETRGLQLGEQLLVAGGKYRKGNRDLTESLNNWTSIARLNQGR